MKRLISYDGRSLAALGFVCIIPPGFEEISARNGTYIAAGGMTAPLYAGSRRESRILPFTVIFGQSTPLDLQLRSLAAVIRFDDDSERELVIEWSSGQRTALMARPRGLVNLTGNGYTLTFEAADGTWQAVTPQTASTTGPAVAGDPVAVALTPGGSERAIPIVTITPQAPLTTGATYSQSSTVTNASGHDWTALPVAVPFDHAAAVTAGKSTASGADIIATVDGTTVPRTVRDPNQADTEVLVPVTLANDATAAITLSYAATGQTDSQGAYISAWDAIVISEQAGVSLDSYPYRLSVDHAAQVTAGRSKADGTDIRVFVNGAEVERTVTDANTADTGVWFPLSIDADGTQVVVVTYAENVVYADGFNRPNSTTIGDGWTEINGDMKIVDEHLTADTDAQAQANRDIASNAIDESATINLGNDGVGDHAIGLLFRVSDSNNRLEARLFRDSAGTLQQVQLLQRVGGVESNLQGVNVTVAANTAYSLRVRDTGTGITVSVDGVNRITWGATDVDPASTVGVRFAASGTPDGSWYLDDLVVRTIESAAVYTGAGLDAGSLDLSASDNTTWVYTTPGIDDIQQPGRIIPIVAYIGSAAYFDRYGVLTATVSGEPALKALSGTDANDMGNGNCLRFWAGGIPMTSVSTAVTYHGGTTTTLKATSRIIASPKTTGPWSEVQKWSALNEHTVAYATYALPSGTTAMGLNIETTSANSPTAGIPYGAWHGDDTDEFTIALDPNAVPTAAALTAPTITVGDEGEVRSLIITGTLSDEFGHRITIGAITLHEGASLVIDAPAHRLYLRDDDGEITGSARSLISGFRVDGPDGEWLTCDPNTACTITWTQASLDANTVVLAMEVADRWR